MISPKTFERGDKKITVNIIEGNGWNFNEGDRNSQVIYSVVELFLNEFSPELLFGGLINIGYNSSSDHPICLFTTFYNVRTILLRVQPGIWNQLNYQLAHELTHFFMKDNSFESDNWFFETLAETASLFFLKKMSIAFAASNDLCFRNYYQHFMTYRQQQLEKEPAASLDPQVWYRQHKDYLLAHKIDRGLNLQAAKMILPLFESLPGAWNVLLFAPLENTPLDQLLPKWIARVPTGYHPCMQLLQGFHSIFLGSGGCQTVCPKTQAD